jgi:SPP1 family predicted phage head-tail adaptor
VRKPFTAGKLRHRIKIETPTHTQDANGTLTTTWAQLDEVYAAIEPLSVRDFIAAQSQKSQVSTRITIRYRAGLTTDMRLIGPDGTIYKPLAFLTDGDSNREFFTIPCTS